jgi:hypothetical protein
MNILIPNPPGDVHEFGLNLANSTQNGIHRVYICRQTESITFNVGSISHAETQFKNGILAHPKLLRDPRRGQPTILRKSKSIITSNILQQNYVLHLLQERLDRPTILTEAFDDYSQSTITYSKMAPVIRPRPFLPHTYFPDSLFSYHPTIQCSTDTDSIVK